MCEGVDLVRPLFCLFFDVKINIFLAKVLTPIPRQKISIKYFNVFHRIHKMVEKNYIMRIIRTNNFTLNTE